nr:MAG TPA: hypothetical protein [Caudoviricetes sp.]
MNMNIRYDYNDLKKKLIDTATGATICEIVSNHSMSLDEAIECAGGEIINDASDERWSPEENVIIDGVYYCYDDLDLVYCHAD